MTKRKYILARDNPLGGALQSYVVVEPRGRGVAGEVYHIRGTQGRGRDFALKLFAPNPGRVEEHLDTLRRRFVTEAMSLLNLNHRNVIHVLDAGEEDFKGDKHPYYVMEFCQKSLHRFEFTDLNQFCQVFDDICSGLRYIHSKPIYHRDIKPSNIMLGQDGFFKISDFGFAKVSDEWRKLLGIRKGESTPRGIIIGDPDRVAPEVLKGEKSDERTDVYMLGKMFKKDLRSGLLSFVEKSRSSKRNKEEIKVEFDGLVSKMLEDGPDDRYQHVEEVAKVLHEIFIRLPESVAERKKRVAKVAESSLYLPAATTIKIPEQSNVPLPEKWMRVIDSREFQRLKKVRQLCTVTWVYPGADHNRFEHSLGTYHTARQTLQNLLRDDRMFSMLDEGTIEIFLASSLLHDLGHYPLSHVIEEITKFDPYKRDNSLQEFTHENMLGKFIDHENSELGSVLGNLFNAHELSVIKDLVSLGYDDIKRQRGNKWAFLKSLLDGPVDIDKIDYLEGDSIHCGVPYGRGFEKFRLISAFTLNEDGDHLAISEKGRASLELLLLSRYTMFTEVYWHHTTRSIMAMLKRAILDLLLGDKSERVNPDILKGYSERGVEKSILGENVWSANPYYYTNDESLWFLRDRAAATGRGAANELLTAILNGRYYKDSREEGIYKRLITFPYVPEEKRDRRSSELREMTQKIDLRMHSGDWRSWTARVVKMIRKKTDISDLEAHHIIFDTARKGEAKRHFQLFYPKSGDYVNISSASPIIGQLMSLFEKDEVRHIRVFCHPKHWDQLSRRRRDIEEAIQRA